MDKKLNEEALQKFKVVSLIDKSRLKLTNDEIDNVITYQDLQTFLSNNKHNLCELSKTQIELILKDVEWGKTVYTILAANRFKKTISHNKEK
jgi:hypothetical protein